MLDALLEILRTVSFALGTYLGIPIRLTSSGTTVKFYDVIVFLFLLPLFIKLMYIVMTKSVNISSGGKK